MEEVVFRPLRRIKKTGKIAVASYMQWRKVYTANHGKFKLNVLDDYAGMPPDEYVYDHEGNPLFFLDCDPYELPVFSNDSIYPLTKHYEENRAFGWRSKATIYSPRESITYHGHGLDCDGVPVFTNLTLNEVATHFKDMNEFEPLTVDIVMKWFGWFLLRLENAQLRVGR